MKIIIVMYGVHFTVRIVEKFGKNWSINIIITNAKIVQRMRMRYEQCLPVMSIIQCAGSAITGKNREYPSTFERYA